MSIKKSPMLYLLRKNPSSVSHCEEEIGKSTMSRRTCRNALLVALILLVLAIPIGIMPHWSGFASAHVDLDPASNVDPFIGTDTSPANAQLSSGFNSGNVFPGASLPQGMVQWSPDTTSKPGGYRYQQSSIYGFSLTHFSGRGCSSYQDFPFMPTTEPITISPTHSSAYASTFSHQQEVASPGYYQVYLNNSNIAVALTATLRSGFGRFTYPSSTESTILINAGGSATGNSDNGTGVQIIGNNQVVGSASSGHFCGKANTYTIYFAAIFDHSFTSLGTWNGEDLTPGTRMSSGKHSGAYVTFDTTQNPVIQVKVGISFVSSANAYANVQAENPGWNFDSVRQNARAAWNARLSAIQVTGGTATELQVFYTALYHAYLHPNVFSDANGQYLGFDGQIHLAQGYIQYDNFPSWDMYRSLVALLALLDPRETSDMMQSLVADAQQSGGGLPRWEVANDNSAGMIGDSPDALIATSYAFGARNFDVQGAWRAMEAGASQPGTRSGRYEVREGLSDYLRLGYVSIQGQADASAAITLEYAIDDFAIAQFAEALGKTHEYETYLQRAHNWHNVFNLAKGYIEPRNQDGNFIKHFDPTSKSGFVEGDSTQYSWLVPQDLHGLFIAMGGNDKAAERLDKFFTQLNAGPTSPYAFMGNEPCFAMPWEFDAAGAAYKTQEVVRRIETQLFTASPGGLPGNDDGGALSSWYVFAVLGIYPEIPGMAGFMLDSPLFPSVKVHMGNGQVLQITGDGASEGTPYVQSLSLNGQDYKYSWMPFDALANGAMLRFTLGSSPNQAWGQ
jgi:predicted alpha-1,2-mannosidase